MEPDVPGVEGREELGRGASMELAREELERDGVDAVAREGGGGRRGIGTLDTEVDLGG